MNLIGWAFPITEFYAKEFQKCNSVENLKVNVQLLNNTGAQEQVRLALAGGAKSPYGIVHAANAQIIEWGSREWLMPLNDLVEKYWDEYDLGDIPQIAWDGATIDGKIYGVPMVGNTLHLQYRKDLFEQYGLKPPTTYDEVIARLRSPEAGYEYRSAFRNELTRRLGLGNRVSPFLARLWRRLPERRQYAGLSRA